ncbi:hypothetical protein [Chondromyces crocatus]|uniref:MAM domain-containing protein n=1 Tax=Chondromyces crocatus TaxID=52 RepID=A0A0K1EA20_CHOCO|nr:hypothetical protein [Chondromyces crocatus]AKT37710.1 uncharacterized protein CMC5_018520 [Chondromyces crocatus]
MTRCISWAFVAVCLTSLGCSKPLDSGLDATGGAGLGGTGAGSAGGGGGEGGGGGAGGDPSPPNPCVIDCSTIQTPACLQGICDTELKSCIIVPTPGGEPCDDGRFCTVGETCSAGVCQGGELNTCGLAIDQCQSAICSEGDQACTLTPKDDGTSCVSDSLCDIVAECQEGTCVGTPRDCFFFPVQDSCKVAACNPATGNCEAVAGNEGAACSDSGDLCRSGKSCQGGLCLGGTPKVCNHLSAGCTNGYCDPGTGNCATRAVQPGDPCDQATTACTLGVCAADGQCVATPQHDGGACDDGNACTIGETCLAGLCQGGQVGGYVVYFSETFANNSAGWTFTPGTRNDGTPIQSWAIGATAGSTGHNYGFGDPTLDHTSTSDNGVAGVVLGGNITKVIHTPNYIESPPINTDVPGPVWLEFRRWLNSDYATSSVPYMVNYVEVWDGATWNVLWQSGGSPGIQDSAWNHLSYDVTAYKSPAMKVRFGYRVGSVSVRTVSSWNIDDVIIANAVCN